MRMKTGFAACLIVSIIVSCSSTAHVQIQDVKGKSVLMAPLRITVNKKKQNTDTVCACVHEAFALTLSKYFSEMGMNPVQMQYQASPLTAYQLKRYADSLHADFVIVGAATLDMVGKSTFLNQVAFNVADMKTGEIFAGGSFKGPSTRAPGVADRIGKKILAAFRKN